MGYYNIWRHVRGYFVALIGGVCSDKKIVLQELQGF
jgi:hypothetical protein